MTRKSLAKEIAKRTKLSMRQAENLVIAFGAVVTDVLERDEKIVYSNFGTFYTVHYPSKVINHPKFGASKRMVMLPTNVAKWLPSGNIKALANGSELLDNPTMHKATKAKEKFVPIKDSDEKTPANVVSPALKNAAKPLPVIKQTTTDASKQANLEDIDDIEAYDQAKHAQQGTTEKPKPNNSNVYDEIMKDGTHEISTFKDAIRVHRGETEKKSEKAEPAQGPFSILKEKFGFGKKTEDKVSEAPAPQKDSEHINLKEGGIFDAAAGGTDLGAKPLIGKLAEQKIDKVKGELQETNAQDLIAEKAHESALPPKSTPILNTRLTQKADIKYKDLSKTTVPKEILGRIPENIARKYKAVPIEEQDGKVIVSMVDPEDIEAKEILKRILGANIEITLATESDINNILSQYQGLESEVSQAIESVEDDEEGSKKVIDRKSSNLEEDAAADDAPAARIVASLLKRAIRDKASDIHIEPTEKEVEVRFRLDGVLKKKVDLPKDIQSSVISRIKILSNLKIDEQRLPQDGRFNITVDNRRVDFRVSTMPVAFGEKIVMRILDKETGILTIEQLGLRGSGLDTLTDNLKKSHGMILVTGPTGSGKTTSLYAMIDELYSESTNIVTLEDPIEYQMTGINQSQVNSDIGYTFANGLRSILRQDPDIVMIGEIRDAETADMAVHAALTGHIVLSTLHTNDASGAAPRMIDMGVEPFLLTSSLNCVIGQRLARKICENCKEEIKISAEEIAKIKEEISKMPAAEKTAVEKKEMKFFKGKGCKNCDNTGYKGRIGLFEALNINAEVKGLILERVQSSKICDQAVKDGMVTMIQDGILKAFDGLTSMEEVWRVTKD
ncbi:MAG: ATPase, T2SS/T4P/T4SS family [Patescibacteria group bacterium]